MRSQFKEVFNRKETDLHWGVPDTTRTAVGDAQQSFVDCAEVVDQSLSSIDELVSQSALEKEGTYSWRATSCESRACAA